VIAIDVAADRHTRIESVATVSIECKRMRNRCLRRQVLLPSLARPATTGGENDTVPGANAHQFAVDRHHSSGDAPPFSDEFNERRRHRNVGARLA
jgi:hypothetical protein